MESKEYSKAFLKAVLGGFCISLGCMAYLSTESKIAGSVFFTIGLFVICTMDLGLFTGKTCYILDNKKSYFFVLLLTWFGNECGTTLSAGLFRLTRLRALEVKAIQLCNIKLNESLLSVFILAFFCNICIYIAVVGFKDNPHELGKYLSLLFGVSVFVLCGFEHCVANMFYMSFAQDALMYSKVIIFLLVNTAGNIAGGLACNFMRKILK